MDASRLERAARALLDAASRIEAETMCVVPRRLVDALRSALAAQPAQAGAYHVVAWAEVHESTGGRHHAAMLMRGEDIIGDFFDPNQAQAACDALNAAEQPAQAGEAVAFSEDVEREQAADELARECFDGPALSAREADLWIEGWLARARHAHPTPRAEAASAEASTVDSGHPFGPSMACPCRSCHAAFAGCDEPSEAPASAEAVARDTYRAGFYDGSECAAKTVQDLQSEERMRLAASIRCTAPGRFQEDVAVARALRGGG